MLFINVASNHTSKLIWLIGLMCTNYLFQLASGEVISLWVHLLTVVSLKEYSGLKTAWGLLPDGNECKLLLESKITRTEEILNENKRCLQRNGHYY